ncbi:MAG: dicarboxylate/amino acid:cation symporter [Christensenellaceae bacterium]|nr:dicarboxylate/amino acid:cation symporter [Christensenellaceae bacterium]
MKKFFTSLPFKLIVGIAVGIVAGLFVPESVMQVIVPIKNIMGQLISFVVPLIVIGFIAPSITKLGSNASKMLGIALVIAYVSSLLAALLSMGAGYALIPGMNIASQAEALKELPADVFALEIPQIMPVMSALVIAVLLGLAAVWTKAKTITKLLDEFQAIVLKIVSKVVIPLLPFFIATTFCCLAYDGTITKQLPVFLLAVVIVIAGHFLWMAVLYGAAGIYTKKNPLRVVKHYGPAYLTAVGTMSSAATLAVALRCAHKSDALREDMVDFGVPLFANIHLCGSVLTETFFCMIVSMVLTGSLPSVGTMVLFCALLAIFAIGAPGVPGGTVMASLGIVSSILGFGQEGLALLLAVFAIQDSFGTACNVTGDGALTMMLTGYCEKHNIEKQNISVDL